MTSLAIDSGGDGSGAYVADEHFSGGFLFSTSDAIDLSGVAGQHPAPEIVYTTERTGRNGSDFQYALPNLTAGESYTVRLHFAEVFWEEAGKRSFDVVINGGLVLDDYDVFVEAGGHDRAVIEEFTATADPSGSISIDFLTVVNNAKVSGIEIVSNEDPPVDPPDPPTSAWSLVADSPLDVFEGQGAAAGGRLYVMGGFVNGLNVTHEVAAYDPVTDQWTMRAEMPEITEEIVASDGVATGQFVTGGITHGSSAVDGASIYVVGGYVGESPGQSTAVVQVYDTVNDAWTTTTDLPAPRGGGGAAIVGRQLHYFGGGTRTFGESQIFDQPEHWVLDLGPTDSSNDDATQWTRVADIPTPRNHSAGASIDGIVYAIGGQLRKNEQSGNQVVLEAYDPATDTWNRRADIPIPLGHLMASVGIADGKIITVGGVTNNGNPAGQDGTRRTATVFSYDPQLDEWSTLESIPDERQSPVVGVIGDEIYVASGISADQREFTTFAANLGELFGVAPPLPGDYDGDGVVDDDDLQVYAANYGATGSNPADGNSDSLVNAIDYLIWRENRTSSTPSATATPSEAAPAPEDSAAEAATLTSAPASTLTAGPATPSPAAGLPVDSAIVEATPADRALLLLFGQPVAADADAYAEFEDEVGKLAEPSQVVNVFPRSVGR